MDQDGLITLEEYMTASLAYTDDEFDQMAKDPYANVDTN